MKKYLLIVLFVSGTLKSFSQINSDLIIEKTNAKKTANVKDILTPYLRAGIDNLLGDKHSFTFNSTFFAIDSTINGSRATSRASRNSFFRNSSFNLGLTGDTVNNIVKFSGGLTLEVLNKKDIKKNKIDADDEAKLNSIIDNGRLIKRGIKNYYSLEKNFPKDINLKNADTKRIAVISDSLNKIILHSLNLAYGKHDFTNLDSLVINALKDAALINLCKIEGVKTNESNLKVAMNLMLEGKDMANEIYEGIATKFARKPLWVAKPTLSYDRINKQGEYSLESNYTFGFGSLDRTAWELEVVGKILITADTSIKTANYKNKPLSLSIGINKVLMQNSNKESKMEFKVFTQYAYKLGAFISNRDELSFNSTLRINVYKSLWLPVTVKYDPKKGNVLGFFSITANLGS